MTQILVKDAPFNFFEECIQAFDTLKRELKQTPIMIKPDWPFPFEIMCDASDFAVGAVLGQRIEKHFKPIHYASKTMNEAQENYTTTKKELWDVVFAFKKSRQYLVLSTTIIFTDHSDLRHLFTKQDAKPRLIRWILLLQEFDIEIRDKKGAKNLAADHLSRLENPDLGKITKAEIRDLFPEGRLVTISDKNNEPCRPSRGHHGIATTARKVFKAGFYRPHIFRDGYSVLKLPNGESNEKVWSGSLILHCVSPSDERADMKNGAIELYDEDGNEFIINKQRVKPYQKSILDTNRDDDITLDDEGEVTLYLTRRSLEVLRKFHWTNLGG
ncbi:reverse transcriptase domain-containing protein [Tanacetum coccineum]|uniref:Reverse transcriptase domain-containing protein n=1 Tax=Tanacetum coccineum TaxID=301880 RepID=A0ABQ5GGF3_9ASTR